MGKCIKKTYVDENLVNEELTYDERKLVLSSMSFFKNLGFTEQWNGYTHTSISPDGKTKITRTWRK